MADTNTKIIIDVALSSDEANQKAKDLGTSIKAIREEQKELKASGKETDVAYQSNAQNLRLLQAEQKAYISISNAAEGSNTQLRAQLALLTQQYNALGKEERDGTVAGKALQVQIKGISDELKVNESAVGDNRRNVGNYKDALGSATDAVKDQKNEITSLNGIVSQAPIGFQILGKQVGNVSNQLQNFRQANKEAKVAQQELEVAQKIATETGVALAAAQEKATAIGFQFSKGLVGQSEVLAVNNAVTDLAIVNTAALTTMTEAQTVATVASTNATKVFKVALASTGIGAIIILVAALVSYLKDFDPIMDKVEQAFSGFKAVVDVVGRVITTFVSNITSVRDLLSKIGGFMAHPIESFKSLGTEMKNAANAAMALKKAQQDLEDQSKIQEVSNARALQQVQELTLQARNRSISEKQRQDLLKKAGEIDQQNFKQRDDIAKKEVKIAEDQIAITAKLTKSEIQQLKERGLAYAFELKDRAAVTDDMVDALQQAEIKRTAILTEATNRDEKRQNLIDAAAERAAAQREKMAAEAQKASEKAADAETVRLESLLKTNELSGTARQNEIAAINQEIDEKVAKYKKYGATTEQLEKERTARLKKINEDRHKEDLKQMQQINDEIQNLLIDRVADQGDRELMQIAANNQKKISQQDELIAATKERIAKGEQGLTEMLLAQQTLRDELLTENNTELSAKQDEIRLAKEQQDIEFHQRELDRDQAVADAKAKIQQEQFDNMMAGTDLLVSIFNKNTAAGKAAFLAQKAVAIAEIIINTQRALAANRLAEQLQNASLSAIPIAGIGLAAGNSIVKAAERTRIIISGVISGAAVLATAVQGFYTGGVFQSDGRGSMVSGAGTGTSDSINAKLSNGEAVINAKSTKMFKPLLSAINMAGGGAALAPGMAMAAGGLAQSVQGGHISRTADVVNQSIDANLFLDAVKSLPPQVVDVRQIVTETQKLQAAKVRADI